MTLIKQPGEVLLISTVKILVYGQPGLGKTTFGLTAPNPLLLDFDRGVRRVQIQHRKPYVDMTSWADLVALLDEDLRGFQSLVIDTAGKCLDALAMQIMMDNPKLSYQGSLSQQGYGVLKVRFGEFVRRVSALGKNLIFIAHDKESKDGEVTAVRPDISGGSMATIIREMDLVGYMQSVNNKRTISFNPSDRYYGKNTCMVPNNVEIEDLNKVNMGDMQFSITKLIETFQHQQNRQKEVGEDYEMLLDVIRDKVDNITDIVTLELELGEIGKLNHLWGSKAVAQSLAKERMKQLNIGYSKDLGYFLKEVPKAAQPEAAKEVPNTTPGVATTQKAKADGKENV